MAQHTGFLLLGISAALINVAKRRKRQILSMMTVKIEKSKQIKNITQQTVLSGGFYPL